MISKQDLLEKTFGGQIYADIDKIYIQEVHYNLINFIFTKKIVFKEDFVWDIYLAQIQKTDYSLDSNIWILNEQLKYPKNKYEQSSKIIELCEDNIKNINTEIDFTINSIETNKVEFIKALILIKILSLAIRRYPYSINQSVFDEITNNSHWIKYASKCLIYINGGCEYGGFSYYGWKYEKTDELCSGNSSAFFMASMCSKAFWVPITSLMFDKLAEKYQPNPKLIEYINNYGGEIRNAFFTYKEEK